MQTLSLRRVEPPPLAVKAAYATGGLAIRLPARSRLCGQDEAPSATFEVLEGAIMVSRQRRDGRRQILDFVGAGHICGRALAAEPAGCYETLVPSVVRIGAVDGDDRRICRELGAALERSWGHAMLLGRSTALERVASGLLLLAGVAAGTEALEDDRPVAFDMPLTRGEIADWLGLVLETVSRNLGVLKRDGLIAIEHQDRVVIPTPGALRAVAGL